MRPFKYRIHLPTDERISEPYDYQAVFAVSPAAAGILFICLSIHPCILPFVRRSIHPCLRASMPPSLHPSIPPSIHPSIHLSLDVPDELGRQLPLRESIAVSIFQFLRFRYLHSSLSLSSLSRPKPYTVNPKPALRLPLHHSRACNSYFLVCGRTSSNLDCSGSGDPANSAPGSPNFSAARSESPAQEH